MNEYCSSLYHNQLHMVVHSFVGPENTNNLLFLDANVVVCSSVDATSTEEGFMRTEMQWWCNESVMKEAHGLMKSDCLECIHPKDQYDRVN